MALRFSISVALLLSAWSTASCDPLVDGVLQVDCNDHYFMMAVDLAVTGEDVRFEAVDRIGAYAITEDYAAECGYTLSIFPFLGLVELRASYFSCHTDQNDEAFMFRFNLITNEEGEEVIYALNQTCSPSVPFSSREVVCEVNYMEVSLRSDLTCSSEMSDDWNALGPASWSSTSEWQVTLQKTDEVMPPMNLSEARKQGYMFDLSQGRIVFRTPYGQPDLYSTEVNGVAVEVVRATLFSRKSWVVFLVDLVAACSTNEGSYDGSYMVWKAPDGLYPSLNGTQISVGLNGDLVEQAVAEQMGVFMEKNTTTVHISIPTNAEGGYRKSLVNGGIFEFYLFHLYMRQITVDEDYLETVVLYHRILITPLLPCHLVTEELAILEEGLFVIFLGNVPEDVELTSVQLNEQEFAVPFTNDSSYSITKVFYPNSTHSYTMTVPLNDSVVTQQFSKENATMLHKLDVNFTLTVPGNDPYYHKASVMASVNISPPVLAAVCTESGISFKLDHLPSLSLWELTIGSNVLTPELAAKRGYTMTNDSQSLLLDVPLFTLGYEYRNITVTGFLGTFEVLVRDRNTSKVQTSTVKTCRFNSTGLVLCSTDGWMTVVADLSAVLPSGEIPARTHLTNEHCGPREADGTRVLFSFPLNSCGSTIKLTRGNVTYRNKIFYNLNMNSLDADTATEGATVQCTYPLAGLHRLFSEYNFESEGAGFGRIVYTKHPTAVLPSPTAPLRTTVAPQKTMMPMKYLPAFHPSVRYIKVSRGTKGYLQIKQKAVHF
ncbi:uncharacterized protein LOC121640773 [Melanotaenia boesemani]|uniref:uncharacterized protein LOC121640773 n=1 Tax=Melanotaenia boesemani TaxID=1250792 RepID=UPI001C0437CA|nr:uncharacterized protein LOC121640773 [Melanotaenia boesemani]